MSSPADPALGVPPLAAAWRTVLRYDLFLLSCLILASRLATILHELVGHALIGMALGAEVRGVHISLFGGGWTAYAFADAAADPAARCLAAFGGIAVNVLTGFGALALVGRLDGRPAAKLAGVLFASISILGAIAYAALGGYYGAGDPVAWMEDRSAGHPIWIPCLAAAPAASYAAARAYLGVQERFFPCAAAFRRAAVSLATVGIAAAAYAGFYVLEAEPLAATRASGIAYRRAEDGVRSRKKEDLVARLRAERPDWTEAEIRRWVERSPIPVSPDEVPRAFPLPPLLAAAFAGGAAAAFRRSSPRKAAPAAFPSARAVALTVGLAALALAGLAAIPARPGAAAQQPTPEDADSGEPLISLVAHHEAAEPPRPRTARAGADPHGHSKTGGYSAAWRTRSS